MRHARFQALSRRLTFPAGAIILSLAVAVPGEAQRRTPVPPPPQQPAEPPLLQPPSTARPAAPMAAPALSRTPSPAPPVRPMTPASEPPPAPQDSAAATTLRAPRRPEAPAAAPPRPAPATRQRQLQRGETVADIEAPDDARVRCKDGTYLTGEPTVTSCTQRGGIAAVLEAQQRPAPPPPLGPDRAPAERRPQPDAPARRP